LILKTIKKDEIIKLKGGFTLDINLEKSRSTQIVIESNSK